MRKMMVAVMIAIVSVGALANSQISSFNLAGTTAVTNTVPISGWLDRVEISGPAAGTLTCTVTVASYDALNAAIETYAAYVFAGTNKAIRTRIAGTDNTGASLTYSGTTTNNPQIRYERPLVGGNLKAIASSVNAPTASTNAVKVEVFYSTDKMPIVP